MTPVLEIRGLSKRFGELQALDRIDLTVAERGVHSVIGPNGAGKTTRSTASPAWVTPDDGAVTLRGQDITTRSVVERVTRSRAYVPGEPRVRHLLGGRGRAPVRWKKAHLRGGLGLRL